MKDLHKCAFCEKPAIGFQVITCSYLHVCEDHADSHILALKPGETQSCGPSFYFERFPVDES
ncbi:MAG: hypothetical protein GYA23_00665 [Methanomicrobiales archaeon]|nr:hypothetical protein [Methanomicrobiales archaeon]